MESFKLGKLGAAIAGASVWIAGWTLILVTGDLSQASHAVMLVLTCVIAALAWRPLAVIVASALSVAAFDWMLIAPTGRLTVDLREDAILLLTMLSVTSIIALLLGQLRAIAAKAMASAERAEQLRTVAEALRDQADSAHMAELLRAQLASLFKAECTVLFAHGAERVTAGSPGPRERDALALCARERRELGAGTGRYDDFPGWVAPLRGASLNYGAVLVAHPGRAQAALQHHARALLALFVASVERRHAQEAAVRARAEQQLQTARSALLASIAHDHRTPLATILGAASALVEQHRRLDDARRLELAGTIVLESERLSRLTDNALRLARLDSPALTLREDWQSAEELIGTVVQRAQGRHPQARFEVGVEADLPLFRADGMLIDQLLDNLVSNAVRHAGTGAPIGIGARVEDGRMLFEVADRGPGLRADPFMGDTRLPGGGLGLAICRAIARAHTGGRIEYRARPGGGALLRASLPLPEAPAGVDFGAPLEAER